MNKFLLKIISVVITVLITACGGGEEEQSSAPSPAQAVADFREYVKTSEPALSAAANFNAASFTLGGVAFAGGPLLQTSINVRDAAGRSWSGSPSLSTAGHWAIALPVDAQLPLLVRASGYLAGQQTVLFSHYAGPTATAKSTQYLNITPYTDALTRRLYSGGPLEGLMNNLSFPLPAVDQARASQDAQALRRLLETYLSRLALPRDIDFFKHFSQATGWGYSGLIERISAGYDSVNRLIVLNPLLGASFLVPNQGVTLPLPGLEFNVPELSGIILERLAETSRVMSLLPRDSIENKPAVALAALHKDFFHNGNYSEVFLRSAPWSDLSLKNVTLSMRSCEATNRSLGTWLAPFSMISGRVCSARLGWSTGSSGNLIWGSLDTKLLFSLSGQRIDVRILGNRLPSSDVMPTSKLAIRTNVSRTSVDRITYVPMQVDFTGAEGIPSFSIPLMASSTHGIRGRGNSTWEWYLKKPYRMKFSQAYKADGSRDLVAEPKSIAGRTASRDWVLLAQAGEEDLLVTPAALKAAKIMGIEYVNSAIPVQLIWNGEQLGHYMITEAIEGKPGRVPADTSKTALQGGGYVLEMGMLDKPGEQFVSAVYGLPVMIKDAKSSTNADVLAKINNDFSALEEALRQSSLGNHQALAAQLDLEAAGKYLAHILLTNNLDGNSGRSAYVYRTSSNSKFKLGPPWDFDVMTFDITARTNFDLKFFQDISANPDVRNEICKGLKRFLSGKVEFDDYVNQYARAISTGYLGDVSLYRTLWQVPRSNTIFPYTTRIQTFYKSRVDHLITTYSCG